MDGKRVRARKAASQDPADALTRPTFREVAEAFIERKEGGWRNDKHGQQWRTTLAKYVYPVIGELPVSLIGTSHVLAVLEPIWSAAPETASRVRGRIEIVLSRAEAQGMRSSEKPAHWRGHLDQVLAQPRKVHRGHHAALAYLELPAFIAQLRRRQALAAYALEFSILSAARTGDAIAATWSDIDLAAELWTVPAHQTKIGKVHIVPLSPRAVAILMAVQPLNKGRADARLFPATGGGELLGMAMPQLLRRMHRSEQAAQRPGWIDSRECGRIITPFGSRTSFYNWAGEQTAFPRELIEHALAHQGSDKGQVVYPPAILLSQHVKLMNIWTKYCASLVPSGDHAASFVQADAV